MESKIEVYKISDIDPVIKGQPEGYDGLYGSDEAKSENSKFEIECEYDPKTNTSKLYRVSKKTGKKVFLKEYKNKVLKIKKDLTQTLLITKDQQGNVGMIDHSGKEVVEHKFSSINFVKIRKSSKTFLRVRDSKGMMGIISAKGKEILPCEYRAVDLRHSEYVGNGEVRFLAQGPSTSKYDTHEKWGVVNNKGTVLLPFNYEHNGENAVHSYKRYKEVGRPLKKYLCMIDRSDKKAKVVWINVQDDKIFATTEVLKKFEKFEKQVELKAKRMEERYRDIDLSPAKSSSMSEDERHAIAFGVAIIAESPIAGLIVNEMLKD